MIYLKYKFINIIKMQGELILIYNLKNIIKMQVDDYSQATVPTGWSPATALPFSALCSLSGLTPGTSSSMLPGIPASSEFDQ